MEYVTDRIATRKKLVKAEKTRRILTALNPYLPDKFEIHLIFDGNLYTKPTKQQCNLLLLRVGSEGRVQWLH